MKTCATLAGHDPDLFFHATETSNADDPMEDEMVLDPAHAI